MEDKHVPEVVTSRQKSDFVHGDLVSRGYGSGSLARPHGHRTPTCYLAQHPECVVEVPGSCSCRKGTPGRAAAQKKDRASKLVTADRKAAAPLVVSLSSGRQSVRPQEHLGRQRGRQLRRWYALGRQRQTKQMT